MNNSVSLNQNIYEDNEYVLTAIVLVYNGEPYLDNCLNSLVTQTLDNLEIILINDASTDDSLITCKKYEQMYDNVRLINREENAGLGANANLGISLAKGEYVILVDNDDIVPKNAYEKLYTKAKETNADICIGKANFIRGNSQFDFDYREGYVWRKDQVITDVANYPELFEDVYYWNQVVKRELLINNNVKLPTGTVYADRYFTHMTYTYAKKIVIIPDCVYLWRQVHSSLSHGRFDPDNFMDRLDSYDFNLDYYTNFCSNYFKILLRRFLIPINGVLTSNEFGDIVFNRMRFTIKNQEKNFEDLYDNDLTLIENLYAFLISNNLEYELIQLLQLDLIHEREVVDENGVSYWKLPLFRNSNIPIPDTFFEIRQLMNQFVNIGNLIITKNKIIFSNIRIPRYLTIEKFQIVLVGVTHYNDVMDDNVLTFDLNAVKIDNHVEYGIEISIDELNGFEMYDVYLKAVYMDEKYNKLRINEISIDDFKFDIDTIKPIITKKGNISLATQNFDNKFTVNFDENNFNVFISGEKFKKNLKMLIRKDSTNELTYFTLNDSKTAFKLDWKYFLDPRSVYSLFLTIYNDEGRQKKNVRFTERYLENFVEKFFITNNNIKLKFFKNKHGHIMIQSF